MLHRRFWLFTGLVTLGVLVGVVACARPTATSVTTTSTPPSPTPRPTEAAPSATPTAPATATPTTAPPTNTPFPITPTTLSKPTIVVPGTPSVKPSNASIELIGLSATHVVLAPGQTGTISVGNGEIDVLVHYPNPIGSTSTSGGFRPYQVPITVNPPTWQVEVGNIPTSTVLSFHLRGTALGHYTVQIGAMPDNPAVTFGLDIVSSPAAAVSTPSGTRSVTLADNGTPVTMHVGDTFLLNLGEGYDWTVNVADQSVLSREVNVLVIRGAQGIYRALKPGTTTLTATGDPLCRKANPPCGLPSRLFKVTVEVQP